MATGQVRLTQRPSDHIAANNRAIARRIERTERLARLIPVAAAAATIGLLLSAGSVGRGDAGGTFEVASAITAAAAVAYLVRTLVALPLRAARYGGITWILGGQVDQLAGARGASRAWISPTPGALALTSAGRLVLIERSTGYEELWLTGADLVDVCVGPEGRPASRNGSGQGRGGRASCRVEARSVGRLQGRDRNLTDLAIRYRLIRNGAVHTAMVPFGPDRRGAETLGAAIGRLQRSA